MAMAQRIIFKAPSSTNLYTLSDEAQINALYSNGGTLVGPMPGTMPYNSEIIIDATYDMNFDLQDLIDVGLNWTIVARYTWDFVASELTVVQALDEEDFYNYLSPTYEFDDEGNIINTIPPVLNIPHNFGGWPQIVLTTV